MLAVIASQALHITARQPPPHLRGFTDMIRGAVRPVVEDRVLGPELERLADRFTEQVHTPDDVVELAVA